jgi:two-component system, NtrC family, sensor kinase
MKVLIADDDFTTRRLLQSYLEKWGHEVTAAKSGSEALELFERGDYSIVVTDWSMPEVDGIELIGRIRSIPRAGYVYIVLVTARAQAEDVVQGIEAGADDFVAKPFDRDELRARIRAGERIVSSLQTIADLRAQLRSALARLGQTLDS